jgi:SPP1 family predicted phage head-tail adaptor
MNAGQLRHLVTIEIPTVVGTGSRGQDEYAYTELGNVWADIEPLQGKKLEISRQLVATATHQVTTRYLPGVVPEGRVTFGQRVFQIGYVINKDERNVTLQLLATEVQ